ncbi:MAG: ferredoxin [Actinomycetota bacterium]|jgi:ferredoxin|nr:ferredoxin [Actinomycetota bacterium]
MRVSVDLDRCEAHGVCTGIAPDVFELDDDDVLHVLLPTPPDDRLEQMREAATRCPKQAITVED